MGRSDLIGNSKRHLIPTYQPAGSGGNYTSARKKNSSQQGDSVKRRTQKSQTHHTNKPSGQPKKGQVLSQHTGLPPRRHK
ncbi:Fe-S OXIDOREDUCTASE [Moraxella catarrhalis]|uniref:Fe-S OXIDOREDUCTASE n=1 Tax=Moraxella catarrhalis TaxID=480 RepID=A0A198UKR9_MORCA|nr:Fe-S OXIDOREDUCTASE [Moraxella catarrhalis]OAU95485.1 Fe-S OXIDOREDUCTASE [Moraxella catarrhalis]OAU96971.1 Fe-S OXIDOREDUCTASE [Moraxella catarrhalis]